MRNEHTAFGSEVYTINFLEQNVSTMICRVNRPSLGDHTGRGKTVMKISDSLLVSAFRDELSTKGESYYVAVIIKVVFIILFLV